MNHTSTAAAVRCTWYFRKNFSPEKMWGLCKPLVALLPPPKIPDRNISYHEETETSGFLLMQHNNAPSRFS
jgi:hypothetical protein